MLPGGTRLPSEPIIIYYLLGAHVSWVGPVYYVDPAQPLTTAGGELDHLQIDHDLSDVSAHFAPKTWGAGIAYSLEVVQVHEDPSLGLVEPRLFLRRHGHGAFPLPPRPARARRGCRWAAVRRAGSGLQGKRRLF